MLSIICGTFEPFFFSYKSLCVNVCHLCHLCLMYIRCFLYCYRTFRKNGVTRRHSVTGANVEQSEIDLVRRALVLRKALGIGILWADDGRYWVSGNQFDPFGSRERVSLDALRGLVDAGEASALARQHGRKKQAVEILVEKTEKSCA